MAYLVLALGALLSIGGLLSIYSGHNIVEIERGWTAVIAGTTALSGGIVTIALGMLLKTLLDMRATGWQAMTVAGASSSEPPSGGDVANIGYHDDTPAPQTPPSRMTPELEDGLLAAIMAHEADPARHGPALELPALTLPSTHHSRHDAETRAELGRPDATAPSDFALRDEMFRDTAPAKSTDRDGIVDGWSLQDETVIMAQQEPPSARRVTFRGISTQTTTVEVSVPEPVADAPAKTLPRTTESSVFSLQNEDWLDRAFSDLDSHIPLAPSREETAPSTDQNTTVVGSSAEAASGDRDGAFEPAGVGEPGRVTQSYAPARYKTSRPTNDDQPSDRLDSSGGAEAALAPPTSAPSTSAVIGRYESDGTSYVMYADGSIEAQSEAGVFHFTSMSELKAFIEGAV